RAIALCGDADALIRALTKTYALLRFPRRFAADLERNATHPSLAHRLQAIRGAANAPAAPLADAVTLTASAGAGAVTFFSDRLEWQEGPAALYRIAYGGLSELRIDVRSGQSRLVAIDTARHRWEMPLAGADVARAQGVLDAIDARLGKSAPAPMFASISTRSMALMSALSAAGLGQIALAFVAAIAVVKPAPRLVAAAGVAGLATAALVLRDASDFNVAIASMSLVCAAFLLVLAFMRRSEPEDRMVRACVALLAIFVAAAVAEIVSDGLSLGRIHQGARGWPAPALLSAAPAR